MPSTPVVAVRVDAGAGRPDVIWLDNGVVRLGAVPELGGRILSVQYDGAESLWRNGKVLDDDLRPVGEHVPTPVDGSLGDWVNYGGDKTWPAPQGWSGPGEWAGPPDPVLDSGPYTWAVTELSAGARVLTMTSADDPRTGLRLGRVVTVECGDPGFSLTLSATNTSSTPVRWALWNVAQRRSGELGVGGVDIGVGVDGPDGPGPDVVPIIAGTGYPEHTVPQPGRVHVPHQDVVGKIGFPTASGWLAHTADGVTCTLRFEPQADEEYPDGGSRAEVWLEHPLPEPLADLGDLDPPDRIVEIEVLGPLVTLQPGASTHLTITYAYTARGAS